MESRTFKNSILKALDFSSIDRLHLRRVEFELMHELEFPGMPIDHMYFVEEGMASITTTFQDGSQVEVGMFGYESIVGVSALMGTKMSLNRIYTQIPGHGYCCTHEDALREFNLAGQFHSLCLRSVQAQLVLAMQSAGCNAKHDIEQRLARWLLICADRAHTDTFEMSHVFLAEMLGSTRSSVSTAAAVLKHERLIDYTRGTVQILAPEGLRKRACECYMVIREHLENIAEFDSGIAA